MRPLHVLAVVLVVAAGPLLAQSNLPAPKELAATSATKSAVALAWSSPDPSLTKFVVERKPLGASWTPPAPPAANPIVTTQVTGVTWTDTAIGAFVTYVYRVRAAGASGTPGPASNEITVGPPPVGFSQVIAQPAKLSTDRQFAPAPVLALDANSDPALAYVYYDPDNNSDNDDTTLHFVSWNRAKYRWNAPVTIGVIGDLETNDPRQGISLTRDASTNMWGLAHMKGTRELRFASSDDGVVWKDVNIATADEGSTFGEPSVAMDKGRVFIAYGGAGNETVFISGLATDPPAKWSGATAPLLPDTFGPRRGGVQVAVDAAGKPAVIYWLVPDSGYNVTLAFWRPEAKTVVKVSDTNGEQSDVTDSRLSFSGNRAVIAFFALRDKLFWDNQHQVWVTTSADSGVTWTPAAPMPADGGNSVGPPVEVAIDSQGHPAVVAYVDGGNSGGKKCGSPKVYRQNGTSWSVCAPDTAGSPASLNQSRVVYAENNKLYISFRVLDAGGNLRPGIALWRER